MADAAIIAMDTATADAVVGATVAGEVVCARRAGPDESGRPRHAAVLLTEVEACVAAAGGWERVGSLAVGTGPGTFTGLRVGVTTARALAQARGLPLAGFDSLAALARGIGPRSEEHLRLPLIDARRGEVFAALYDRAGRPVWEPFTAGPAELVQRLGDAAATALAAGDGALRFRADLEAAGVDVLPDADPGHRMAARHVCDLAVLATPGPPSEVGPAYLRRPDAEVWREQRDRNHERR